ncbi:MAG: formate dehydrogenase accessory protein FdhE [Firmicutes bacterium]|nr:formate dehydrogenase accessory protein FdhE [Bacillota bacterium]
MINFPPTDEHIQIEIKHYVQKNEQLEPLLLFYQSMYRAQKKYIEGKSAEILRSEFGMKSQRKEAVLLENGLSISLEVYQDFMLSLLDDACRHLLPNLSSSQRIAMEKLLDQVIAAPEIRESICVPAHLSLPFLQSLLAEKLISLLGRRELAVLAQIIRAACQIDYVCVARRAQSLSLFKNWQQGICPVCGEKPMLAMLREQDGVRMLECGLCHAQWTAPRLGCLQCGNTDQDSLGFFFIPGQEYRRVYVCHECKYYLKTIVLKEINREVIPDLENIATYFLDDVAQKEGFGYNVSQTEIN